MADERIRGRGTTPRETRPTTASRTSNWPTTGAAIEEGFLLAALVHDVGKAIDRRDHVLAGLQALEGTVSERTETLIALPMDAHAYRDGTLGARARSRLRPPEEFDVLMLLRELDSRGRQPGAVVCELAEGSED